LSKAPQRLFAFFASYGLSCGLFVLLLLLTYLGTLYQVEHGLYEAQRKYFQSVFLVHRAFGFIPAPLPGGYLLLILLFVNLFLGGIVRARKGWSTLGILISHAGICVLLIGAFITFRCAITGYMTLGEGESANEFQDDDEWEIALAQADGIGLTTERVIREQAFAQAGQGERVAFHSAAFPFDVAITGYAKNAAPLAASHSGAATAKEIDGFTLMPLDPEREPERNLPGAYVTLTEKGTGVSQEGIVWGGSRFPLSLELGGTRWVVDLRSRRRQLPFTITLNTFTRELYPGTEIPRAYVSHVTKTEDGVSQDVEISMNAPLRHRGYTFYQSSWDARPDGQTYSIFAVVRNPAERFPIYACVIITFGLMVHFTQKFILYLSRESRKARSA